MANTGVWSHSKQAYLAAFQSNKHTQHTHTHIWLFVFFFWKEGEDLIKKKLRSARLVYASRNQVTHCQPVHADKANVPLGMVWHWLVHHVSQQSSGPHVGWSSWIRGRVKLYENLSKDQYGGYLAKLGSDCTNALNLADKRCEITSRLAWHGVVPGGQRRLLQRFTPPPSYKNLVPL